MVHKLSGKLSCRACWNESKNGSTYLDLMRSNHHYELVRQFAQDQHLHLQIADRINRTNKG